VEPSPVFKPFGATDEEEVDNRYMKNFQICGAFLYVNTWMRSNQKTCRWVLEMYELYNPFSGINATIKRLV
jgi:hypothetical protein